MSGGLDAVDPGHSHVHQHHLRAVPGDQRGHLRPVRGLGDDPQVRLGVEDGPQPDPDQFVVVDDQHVHAHPSAPIGSRTRTRHTSPSTPAVTRPPSNSTRSRIPISPRPPPGAAAPPDADRATALINSISRPSGDTSTRTVTGPWPCRAALVNPSCTIR